jgi:hypothetical protein
LETLGLLYDFTGIEANAKGVAQVMTRVTASSPFSSSGGSSSTNTKKISTPFQTMVKKLGILIFFHTFV